MATSRFLCAVSALLMLCCGRVIADEPAAAHMAERRLWNELATLLNDSSSNSNNINASQPDGMTALHWAVWHEHSDAVSLLLKHQADASAKTRYGVTPLSIACLNGNAQIVRQLLQAAADVHAVDPGGETLLMTAARTGRREIVELLLQHPMDVNAKERSGQTAIMWAAAEGHADVVSALISAGADIQTPLNSGFSPFFFAVREGHLQTVDVFLKAGVDVNSVMEPKTKGARVVRNGTSALLLAIENGHFELAEHLLRAGADANDQRSGLTALHALAHVRKPDLGDNVEGDPAPIGSGNVTSLQLVTELVRQGADVNAQLKAGRSGKGRLNRKGATPFLMAADTADVRFMKQLLQLGADPFLANADNCPPILAAAGIGTLAPGEEAGTEEEALAAVQLLLDLGADINAVDNNGETTMHGAAYKSLPRMVQFLADHGADVKVWNTANKFGWTPLLIAEGYRPGNFKPAAATIAAVRLAMKQAGVEPPPPTGGRPTPTNDQYAPKKK